MKCPVDATDLLISERSGVEIDYCPQCRGVWLDRGELDKIIDRASDDQLTGRPAPGTPYYDPRQADRGHGHDRGRGHDDRSGRRRRGGMLGDLFDF
ncbi:TFIIB-type zinc ribbon-containing protein [Microbacterium sp. MMO-10]|uniref:TFIIB-type zinc ribbon-containing protein n=1 Tax=Microbacterium sp. MMO-10 TaxID=3081272 RepID=UPI0030168127